MTGSFITSDLRPRSKRRNDARWQRNLKRYATLRDLPAMLQAVQAVGAPSGAASGNRSIQKSLSKWPTIILPAGGFVTAQRFCAGEKIKPQSNAQWIRSRGAKENQWRCFNFLSFRAAVEESLTISVSEISRDVSTSLDMKELNA